ncbi:MAG: hypothetical protein QM808_12940 [Steroidobacteraceae bacterium]
MQHGLQLVIALTAFVGAAASAGEPLDVRVGVDLRAVAADSPQSFLQGGLGRTRFDEDHQGLRFGSAYLAARYRLGDTVTMNADALSYADGNGAGVDVTEAYLQWRPFPSGPWRVSAKLGAFYPGVSMEHRGPAWTPVYTLTPSALNAWIGEELRAIGVEAELRWLGASSGYQGDVALIGGVYGWNDPIGVVIAARGWAPHERQTGLFGYLPTPGYPQEHIHEFREIDGRPGYYAGLSWRHADALELRGYHYDNRADPGAKEQVYAWLTRFDAVGARWQPDAHWTALAQVLRGDTYIGPQATWGQGWDMDAWFVLGSYEWGAWRASLRYEEFGLEQFKGAGAPLYDDDGHALTLGAAWQLADSWQLAAEWLQVHSTFGARQDLGLAPRQDERQLQLSLSHQWHW